MMRRQVGVTVVLVVGLAALGACENKPTAVAGAALPSRAKATGEFPDNPLLAFAPADTPYAFASFKPVPIELIRKMTAMVGPMWRKAFEAYQARSQAPAEQRQAVQDAVTALEKLDVKTFEQYGFSATARFVAYGLGGGAYPAFRAELSNGDRVFELVRTVAERWHEPLPAPTERAGRRYWTVDLAPAKLFVAIAAKELVVAIAPSAVIDANLPALLGEQRPARSLTTAQFRAIAERDGFTGQGLGFADLARVGALIGAAIGASPDCTSAIAEMAQRMPRMALGYDDFTARRLSFGLVVELAPAVVAELRGLSSTLAGLDRLLDQKPAMAMAVAVNLERGRALAGRVAGVMQDLGKRCDSAALVSGWAEVAAGAARPLPPFLAGARGGLLALTRLEVGPGGPKSIEGFASLQADHADQLIQLAASQLPGLSVPLDGKAHALPAQSPFPGHIAADAHAIGVGLGPSSASDAVRMLGGKPAPAPLVVFAIDYGRLADLMLAQGAGPEIDDLRGLLKGFGLLTNQLLVDDRGVVSWMSLEMR